MRRLLVLLALVSVSVGSIAALGTLAACGGNDKPPLTPDLIEPPPPEPVEAGAPTGASPSAAPTTSPAPTK